MLLQNFLEWFETCPAWQALALSLAGLFLLLALQKLVSRRLARQPGQRLLGALWGKGLVNSPGQGTGQSGEGQPT
jgi:hypothetical protein